ncbi:MAG: hypothetical protein U0840_25450 [Gemmataceae bacterium]
MQPDWRIVLAHAANGLGWLLTGSTPLLVYALGKPGFVGFILAMPFFAVALGLCNAAARRVAPPARTRGDHDPTR